MPDELRPRQVPVPPQDPEHLVADKLPGPGRTPIPSGKVFMTDYTRKQLAAVGWKEGDPVPGDLGQRLKEIQQEVLEESRNARIEDSPLAANWSPVDPKFVDITKLPADKQAEIGQYLQEYKAQVAQEKQTTAKLAEVDSQIPENIQGETRDIMRSQIMAGNAAMAARTAAQSTAMTESVTIDDRQTTSPPVTPQPSQKVEAAKSLQTATPDTGVATITATHCQRCNWPLSTPFIIEPTKRDKQVFMAAILGMSRFEKEYELLGGNLRVTFRSLSAAETTLLQQQLGAMVRVSQIVGDGEYWAHMQEFRTVMAVKEIVIGQNVAYAVPSIETWAASNPPPAQSVFQPTPLPRMRDYFYEHGAKQEPVRRIIGQTHANFQRLVELLEVMSNDSDFWNGIELPV